MLGNRKRDKDDISMEYYNWSGSMRIGGFEIRAKENTKWDYVIPWGLGFSWLAIFWFFKFSYSWSVDFEELIIASVVMVLSTLVMPRFFRIFVFPFGIFVLAWGFLMVGLIDVMTSAMLSEVATSYGFGYIIGALAIYLDRRVSGVRIKLCIVAAFIGFFMDGSLP